jgi:hypothetical protein
MKRIITISIISLLLTSPALAYQELPWTELTIHPVKTTYTAKKIRLLPTSEEQTDTDAVPLYQKAIQSLPDNFPQQQFSEWRKLPPDQLPAEQVESEIKKLQPTLDLVSRAARSKNCNWPFIKPEQAQQQLMNDLSKYRQICSVLNVQAKLQIAQGQFDSAIKTITTGLTMAQHLGDAPTLIQGMVGISIAKLNLDMIEQLIQSDNPQSLYWALEDLPQPLVDMNKAIKIETDNLKNYNILLRNQFEKQLKPAHERVRKTMNYNDRKTAALQCIEALRLYAGTHGDKFPEKLDNVTEVKIPMDPVTKKLFSYKSTGSEAILELDATENSEGRDAVRYELKLK